jgi:tetratricopeptide (TPR) repeat protein
VPTIPEALAIAFSHHQRGELAQAEDIYRQIVDHEPNHADAWHLWGVAAHQAGRHEEGIAHIQRALAIAGPNANFLNHLGATFASLERHQEAEDAFRQASTLAPHDAQAHYNLAALLNLRGNKAEAIQHYQRAVAIAPTFAEAQFNLGNLLRDSGDNFGAERCFAAALAARPNYVKSALSLANVQLRLDKLTAAESTYRIALQADPDNVEAHYWLGSLLQQQNRMEEAAVELQAAVVRNPRHVDAQINLGCVYRALKRAEQAEQCFRIALDLSPEYPPALCNLGSVLHDRKEYDAAADLFRRAILINPVFVEAHNNLGTVFQDQKRFDDAYASFKRALQLRPDSAETQLNVATALQMQGHLEESLELYAKSIANDPTIPRAHYCLGAALHTAGRDDEALAAYAEAIRLQPDYAEAHYNRSFVHLARGEFEAGWREYEWRLRCKDYKGRKFPVPRWDGSPLAGRTLLVHAEQGLGDTLHFIRYLKKLQQLGGSVYVEVPPAVVPLLKQSGFTGIIPGGSPLPKFDLEIPLLSVPYAMQTRLETIPAEVPYLAADPRLIKQWRGQLRSLPGYKVGLIWQGNRDYAYDHFRSIPLAQYAPLAEVPGVQLISLQKGYGSEQVAALGGKFSVLDWGSTLDTTSGAFMDTAAVMSGLDLVISSDTGTAHLAGGLGVPVWLAVAHAPEWRWMLERKDCPWYPTMRLFRQRATGDWSDVFEAMREELAVQVQKRATAR